MPIDRSTPRKLTMNRIRIAVLSDLHCDCSTDSSGKKESFLSVGSPRVPSGRHPIQALVDLAVNENMSADVILCPGDMTNKISVPGLSHAWDCLRNDVKNAFNANAVFCTLGNHDVSSRSTSTSPFDAAKYIHPEFPFKNQEDRNQFWARGFCLQRVSECADILIINSTYDHFNEEAAQHGTFKNEQIMDLDSYLSALTLSDIRVAVLHHHPILHSFINYSSSDVIPTGDQLLDILGKHKFDIVIHGHRHYPRIRRHSVGIHNYHIFCAGSFSAYLSSELSSRTRNVFHIIELFNENGVTTGVIKTWEFNIGLGWNPTAISSSDFPHMVCLGAPPPCDIKGKILKIFSSDEITYLNKAELRQENVNIDFLLPDETYTLATELSKNHGLKFEVDILGNIIGIGKIHSPRSSVING